MAARMKCQNLLDFRTFLRKVSNKQSNIETDEFQVITIQRYLSDPRHGAQTRGCAGEALDVIQVTVTDGSYKMKMLLHSELNSRVQKHELGAGSTFKITSCSLHYDETDLSGSGIVVIKDVEITGVKHVTEELRQGLQWTPDCSSVEKGDAPLTSSRGYFVNLWSSMEMNGPAWHSEGATSQSLGDVREEDLYCIKDLATQWNSIRATKPAVLVRVIMKSRLIHYAKPNKDDKWPFQAHILVADQSGACTVVLWNEMCPKFYHSIKEGSLLLLKCFTVKRGFQYVPRFRPWLRNTEFHDIDINLNSHHPRSEVRIIDPGCLSDNVQLVPWRCKLLNRRQVGNVPSNTVCDIVGLVTYVGRYEREHIVNKHGTDSGGFWVRLWLHLHDRSSHKPLIVQVYRLAEGLGDTELRPGSVMMITNVRVVQKFSEEGPSSNEKYVYLSTTAESHVSAITDSIRDHPAVRDVLAWSQSTEARGQVRYSLVGGYYSYPPLPSTVEGIKASLKDYVILVSEDWEQTLTSLCYREQRLIMVQAVMVAVKLRNLETINMTGSSSTGKGSKAKQRKLSSAEIILDHDIYQSDEGLPTLGQSTTQGGTLPLQYSTDRWEEIQHRLDFVGMQEPQDDATLETTRQVPYFTVVWVGLNTRILLHTILLCPHTVTPDTQFLDILSGRGLGPSSLVTDTHCNISEPGLSSVTKSVRQCAGKRFLLVLDCYRGNAEQTEIVLHRAVPVGDV